MTYIEFFKLQAKNLFKDYKTQTLTIDKHGFENYSYTPKYFDVSSILFDYQEDGGVDLEESLTLMKAQHLIADMLGFRSWHDLLHASDDQLELAKLRFDHQDKISLIEFEDDLEMMGLEMDQAFEIFKHQLDIASFLGSTPKIGFDYRINPKITKYVNPSEDLEGKITGLPMSAESVKELIDIANNAFDSYAEHYNFTNINKMRELWRPEAIIAHLLEEEIAPRLPLMRDKIRLLIGDLLEPFIFELENKTDPIVNNITLSDTRAFHGNKSKNEEITSLPLKEDLRKEFIEEANSVFASKIKSGRIYDIAGAKKRWDPEGFIDFMNGLLRREKLPISKQYALSLIDPFIVNYIL